VSDHALIYPRSFVAPFPQIFGQAQACIRCEVVRWRVEVEAHAAAARAGRKEGKEARDEFAPYEERAA
jgi:hypothetical protein